MKIAFLLGVSNYNSLSSLPACKNDINLVQAIMNSINEYDEICVVEDIDTHSSKVLTQLRGFIEKYNNNSNIDELLFYFSGHGKYENDEFYYALSDFDSKKKRQTSLVNSELDEMLKSLNPKLVVKIIDACNSGVTYIKDGDEEENSIQKHFDASGKKFENCYFMFSSLQNQYSYIKEGSKLSDFTNSFVHSIISTDLNDIRFKDIINYISDYFDNNEKQKPFFVNQATFMEKFGTMEETTKDQIRQQLELLYKISDAEITNEEIQAAPREISLKNIITNDNNNYCSKEEALAILSKIKTFFQTYNWNLELSDFFDIQFLYLETDDDNSYKITNIKEIGLWLNKSEHNFFAEPLYKEEEYTKMVPIKNAFTSLAIISGRGVEEKPVKATRNVIYSFQPTFSQPYFSIRIYMKPKSDFQNLSPFDLTLVYLISKTDIKLFYYYSTYLETAWNVYQPNKKITWESLDFKLKDNVSCNQSLQHIAEEFEGFVINNLRDRFKPEN